MRILFVSIEWPFPDQPYRGPFAKSLADALSNHEEIITLPLPMNRNPVNVLRYRLHVAKSFNYYNCDHIHCYSLNTLLMVNPRKYPVSASAIGSDVFGMVNKKGRYSLKGKLPYILVKNKISRLKGIRCLSEPLKERLEKDVLNFPPISVLPDGIDLTRFSPKSGEAACNELGWDKNRINVYFPGNPERGVKNFKLAKKLVDTAQKELNVDLHVFPGVAPEKMNDYYQAADLVLITSIHEGSSNSLKEALLCNTPVLSTPVGDARYWLDKWEMGEIIDYQIDPVDFTDLVKKYVEIKRKRTSAINKSIAQKVDINQVSASMASFLRRIC